MKSFDRACVQCGLAVSRMATYEQPVDTVAAPLEAAWQAAVTAWHDPGRHDEILRLVGYHDAWAWAARRYRMRLRDNPTDLVAPRALARLERGLSVGMMHVPDPAVGRPYRATMRLLILMLITLAVGMIYTKVIYRGDNTEITG